MRGRALSVAERDEILKGIGANLPASVIAAGLDRDRSVVSREIARNGGRDAYRVHAAQSRAEALARRPKVHKLVADRRLHDEVMAGLAKRWSPQQIQGRLVEDYPAQLRMRVSHETIYQALYLQARGELRTELKIALRQGRTQRRPLGSTRVKQARIAGMVNISERPAEIEDRAIPGHWEGDLIIGKGGKSQVATLVERTTRFLMLVKIAYDRTADRVAARLAAEIRHLPEQLKRSLTWDQGVEMAAHATFSLSTDIPVYFCDPHSPWQRGSNENTNGLIREYLPKGIDLSCYSQSELNEIAASLNERPRRTLGFRTPAEELNNLLAAAGDALTA
ncbi:IS30 family transposase [Acrocarpospora sp. B8E8]|uniref:IS30 family transposase n=1 Tax=Acrocarpospora sp. B8E8 TaxID=3153572 RepID=UPI00325F2965